VQRGRQRSRGVSFEPFGHWASLGVPPFTSRATPSRGLRRAETRDATAATDPLFLDPDTTVGERRHLSVINDMPRPRARGSTREVPWHARCKSALPPGTLRPAVPASPRASPPVHLPAESENVSTSTASTKQPDESAVTSWQRFRGFFNLIDDRYEDLKRDTWGKVVYRDFSAGLIVAMTAIPMAMGFAMASGLRPEYGIVGGAVACLVGRTFGGSKYQVYGPTAAFIPIIYAMTQKYDHGFVVLCSIISGIVLCLLGVKGLGRIARLVPHSVVVGFTVGIAIAIALSNVGEAFGYTTTIGGSFFQKISGLFAHASEFNFYALGLAAITFLVTTYLLKVSIYIPAPLIGLGICTLLASTVFAGEGIVLVADRYGKIPNDFFVFTGPVLPELSPAVITDIVYYVIAIVFVSGVESLLCSSMADRMANNKGTPFNPDKEFFGQGMVQIITPMLQGMPCTGALARTATSIKLGAVTPLAGYFKGVLKLVMAYYMASYLELVPMACIGGILFWVAKNMIKKQEIQQVIREKNGYHVALMAYTAVMVPLTDFLTGVLSALIIYGLLRKRFDPEVAVAVPQQAAAGRYDEAAE
jgi:sulfate permease, SulP family